MGKNIEQLGFTSFSEFWQISQLEADYSFNSHDIIDAAVGHGFWSYFQGGLIGNRLPGTTKYVIRSIDVHPVVSQ